MGGIIKSQCGAPHEVIWTHTIMNCIRQRAELVLEPSQSSGEREQERAWESERRHGRACGGGDY